MPNRSALTLAGLLLVVTACGGDDTDTGADTDVAAPAETTAAPPADDAPAAPGGPTVLLASVGSPGEPEAFEISLTTEDGQEVTELPAGDYQIRVSDPSEIHNFALSGAGVDEATSVPDTDDVTWDVTLEAGDYDYVCTPHVESMNGSFTVTA